jgi:internalin A
MKKFKSLLVIIFSLFLINTPIYSISKVAYAETNVDSLQISDFYLSATTINPQTTPLKIYFTSNKACLVYCYVADQNGNLVAKVSDGGNVPNAGSWSLTWKGLNVNKTYPNAGTYTIGIGLGTDTEYTEPLYKNIKITYTSQTTASNKIITFPDANLEKLIRATINKNSGNIYTSDVQKITKLDIESTYVGDIRNLSGIEYLTNLTYLNLGKKGGPHFITNIDNLGGLKNLRELYLNFNQISNINSLKGLTNLRVLQIGGNKITNIEPLRNLTNLTSLYLGLDFMVATTVNGKEVVNDGSNDVRDLSPIKGLTNLNMLSLYGNANIKNIDALAGMTNLTYLSLRGPHISSISALKGMTHLKYLDVGTGNGKISNISVLSGLTELTELDLAANRISNISALSGLTNLKTLSIAGNSISNLEPIRNLYNLKSLAIGTQCAGGNPVKDLSVLSNFRNLETLELDDLSLANINFLRNLNPANLKALHLKYNNIANIDVLSTFTNLTELMLNSNKITNINALSGLQNLTCLWIDSNKITNIDVLEYITKLTSLHLSKNKIKDFSPINAFYNNIYDKDF